MTVIDTTFAPQESRVRTTLPVEDTTPKTERIRGVAAVRGVVWELAAAGLAVTVPLAGWRLVVTAGVAAAALALTVPRYHGRLPYQWVGVWVRYRRRRARPPVAASDRYLAPLRELAPELSVASATGRTGGPVGILHDGAAWSALLAVASGDDVLPDGAGADRLALGTVAKILAVDDIRLSSVQVVTHVTPAPGLLRADLPDITAAYGELNAGRVPSTRDTWVALRLAPDDCPAAVDARGGGVSGAHRALRRCAARAVELLDTAGLRAQPLGQEQLRIVLAAAAGVQVSTVDEGPRVAESWRTVSCDGLCHLTFWLRGWAPGDSFTHLVELCAAVPALFATVSVTVAPAARARVLVRLSTPALPATLAAGDALDRLARPHGWRLVRLNGEHALGLLDTLPLGGAL